MTVPTLPDPLVDIAGLLERQRAAFLNDGPPDLGERKKRLKRLRDVVLAHRSALGDAVSADFGHRSRHETDIMELVGVIQSIDYLTRNLRRFMKRDRRHVDLFYRAGRAYVDYQPKGVIGVMAPWNYPVSLTLIPLATALAAGNRAMLKPSELTPRTSALMQQMLASVFPAEEVAVVLGGPEVGAAFSALPFDHLLFTGSTPVGRKVMKAASNNLVPVTLELGGKSPAIVAKGHVNERTIGSLVFGKLSHSGQTCVAPDYALVHEDDVEAFVGQFGAAVARAYPAGPTGDDYTSIVNDRHYERLKGLIDDARRLGALVIETGVRPETAAARARTLAPTLVVGAQDDMTVMQEEIFGPILPVRTYRTIDDVIEYVNARPRPLALYYFGERDADCTKLLARTTSGNVGINNTMIHVAQDDLPFGGVGPSGMGAYHGIEGFRAMSHAKGVFEQGRWALPSLLRAPFGRLVDLALSSVLGRRRAMGLCRLRRGIAMMARGSLPGPFSLLGQMMDSDFWGYVLKLPVNTELARVRGVVGYNLPKWLTDISYKETDTSVVVEIFDAQTRKVDVTFETRKLTDVSSKESMVKNSFTNLDQKGSLTTGYTISRQLRHASSSSADSVKLTLGDGSLSTYIKALKLGTMVKYEYVPEFQGALYSPTVL